MNTPSPDNREPYKILRLIGALVFAAISMLLLNALIGPEAPAGNTPDAHSSSVELPASTQPARQIDL
jgi:hypothetical protein